MSSKRKDRRYIRAASVQDRNLNRHEGQLILTFKDFSCESTHNNEAVVTLNRYSVRALKRAINFYQREMTKHHADEAESIKRMCEETGE